MGLRSRLSAIVLASSAFASTALAQAPRIDFAHPVVGENLVVTTEGWTPGTLVSLRIRAGGNEQFVGPKTTDGSGFVRFRFDDPVSAALLGQEAELTALGGAIESGTARVRVRAPQLLLTGVDAGVAYLYRVDVPVGDPPSFDPNPDRFRLGAGRPGGAVRDGRGTKTFVVADTVSGLIDIVPDDPASRPGTELNVAPGVRDIATTADGDKILIVSAATTDPNDTATRGILTILDARGERPAQHILLDPLGPRGGRIVPSPDGLRAFVSVQGSYLREVNLLGTRPGALVAVGRPGQDRIKDLRIVGTNVFALTQSSAGAGGPGAVTGLSLGDFKKNAQAMVALAANSFGLTRAGDRDALVLLDGTGAEITVIDARTMRAGTPIPVPPGADALLLTPTPEDQLGGLLYSDGAGGSAIRTVNFQTGRIDPPRALGFRARAVPIQGESPLLPWLLVGNGNDGIVALDPTFRIDAFSPPIRLDVTSISIGR